MSDKPQYVPAEWYEQALLLVERLQEDNERLQTALGSSATEAWAHLYDETVRLEAKNERLRQALILYYEAPCPICSGDCGSANPPVIGCPVIEARRALDGEKR